MARMGRPPTYKKRTRIVLHVEATEARAMAQCARRAGDPTTAAWMRRVLVEAAYDEAACGPSGRAALAPAADAGAARRGATRGAAAVDCAVGGARGAGRGAAVSAPSAPA